MSIPRFIGLILIATGILLGILAMVFSSYVVHVPGGFFGTYQVYPYVGFALPTAAFGVILFIVGCICMLVRIDTRQRARSPQPIPASPPSSYEPSYHPEPPKITYNQQTSITCEYCGTPMPIAAHFCPNCGAKRGTPS